MATTRLPDAMPMALQWSPRLDRVNDIVLLPTSTWTGSAPATEAVLPGRADGPDLVPPGRFALARTWRRITRTDGCSGRPTFRRITASLFEAEDNP
ncbi:hypothetical protein [Pseudonocardia alaniniphila]|uniref:Uncharacterized protein n=1 Tax=Pseudonocardia alaniniphila TaxID=75291 RepID=A0ABS9TAY8_9PSEU|nr:hypothetical protein [Pseudonocardia alaniniphila]